MNIYKVICEDDYTEENWYDLGTSASEVWVEMFGDMPFKWSMDKGKFTGNVYGYVGALYYEISIVRELTQEEIAFAERDRFLYEQE